MTTYFLRRIINAIPTIFLASILIFGFIHLMPGDPAATILGSEASSESIQNLREEMGLDQSIHLQYINWIKGALKGDIGNSLYFGQSVFKVIFQRIEPSIFIAVISTLIILSFSIPIGIISAVKYNTFVDQITLGGAMLGASVPTFWLGLNLMLLFAVVLGWLPSSGFTSIFETNQISNLKYLILPCITLAAPNSALIIRLTRSSMLDVLSADYIRTARSKGLSERVVVIKHALRNALIGIVSVLGYTFAALMSGTVVTETVFAIPGVGRLIIQSILRRDYPVLQGIILLVVIIYILINLLTDISYGYLDPRIRY